MFWYEVNRAFVNMYASLSGDFGDRDHMIKVGDYVKFLLELGLFQQCHGQVTLAAERLSKTSGKFLIRLGRTALVSLRKRLTQKIRDEAYIFGHDFCHADSPLREVAKALSLPEPRFYEGLTDPKMLTVRYFVTLSELHATVNAVSELIFRAEFIGVNGLGFTPLALKAESSLSHSNIFARCLVNRFLGVTDLLAPISEEAISTIFAADRRLTEEFVRRAKNFTQEWSNKLACVTIADEQEIEQKTQHFLTALLIQFEQNWRLLIG